jgi:hypothetical protein
VASRHHNGGSWITKERRLAINLLRDRRTCAYQATPDCLARKGDLSQLKPGEITLDHLLSREEYSQLDDDTREEFGSVNASHNLVTACKSCNSSRGCKPWFTFASNDAMARILAVRQVPLNVALARAYIAGEVGNEELENR